MASPRPHWKLSTPGCRANWKPPAAARFPALPEAQGDKMDAARHNPLKWIPSLYLAQGLPYFAIALVFGQMMKSMNMPNTEITHWLGFLGAAWIFKPLWS